MEFSLFDLSKCLGVAPKTIERWVRQGKLPVSQKGAIYWFREKDLEKWASTHHISLNFSDKTSPEKDRDAVVTLANAVRNGGVYTDIQGKDVKGVLTAAVEKISDIPDAFKADLLDRLMDREQALSTGIGNGMAIPHPREQLSYLARPMVSICFLADPVDYKGLDRHPVSILFLLLCPALNQHLQLLSVLSFCLRDDGFTRFLHSRPTPDQLIERIEDLQKKNPI